MNIILFLTLFSLLGILYFILGYRASKQVTSDVDYYVAGRSLGIMQISCNLIATQLGGGMLLGTANAAYEVGYIGFFYTWGICLGFLLLAFGVAGRLQHFKVTTTAQLFETQYNSVLLKHIASLLSIATMFGILIAQVVGFKNLLAGAGITSIVLVTVFWLSVVIYTMLGGLRAITINDMVQLALIVAVFMGIFIYNLGHESTGWWNTFSQQSLFSLQGTSLTQFIGIMLMPAFFSLIQQDLAQRFFASKSRHVATVSAFIAGSFLFIFSAIPVYFGIKARLAGMILKTNSNALITYLYATTSDLVFSLVLCAILAAIISTADALMNAVSANITQDFRFVSRFTQNRLYTSKIITLCIGTAALIISYHVPQNIINIIISSYELSVSCLLIPLLFCYYKSTVRKEAAFGAIIAGFIGFIMFRWYFVSLPHEMMALGLSLVGYGIGTLLVKQHA